MSKIAIFEHLKKCSEAAKTFAAGLVGDLGEAVASAIEELDGVKADKPETTSVTIPATGWIDIGDGAPYPKYYDISADGVTASDRADITIAPGSLDVARTAGLCPTNDSLAGKIRIFAKRIPSGDISAVCRIEKE